MFSLYLWDFFIKISYYEVFSWTLILNLNVIKILNLYRLYFWRPKKSFSYRKYILLNVLLFTVGSLFHMELTFFKVWGRIRYLISPYEYPVVLDTINAALQFTLIPLPRVLSSLLVSSWWLSSCWSCCPVYHTDIFLHRECQWQHCPHHVCCCGSTRWSGTGSTRGSGTQAQPKWTHRVSGFSWHCPPLDKIQCLVRSWHEYPRGNPKGPSDTAWNCGRVNVF